MASPRPIHEQVHDSYLQSGLQPSVGSVSPIRNAQVSHKYDPHERRGGETRKTSSKALLPTDLANTNSKASLNNAYSKRSKKKETEDDLINQAFEALQHNSKTSKFAQQAKMRLESLKDADFDEESFEELLHLLPSEVEQVLKRRGIIRKILLLLAYRKAFRRNMSIWSWGVPAWLNFQLPFAILSLVFLFSAILVDKIFEWTTVSSEQNSWFSATVKTAVGWMASAITWTLDTVSAGLEALFGFDPFAANLGHFFVGFWLVVMAFGFFMLLTIYLIYALSFLRPLSGDGSGAKMGMFLLALIGYSIPVLNLLPWFLPWTIAVLRYPK